MYCHQQQLSLLLCNSIVPMSSYRSAVLNMEKAGTDVPSNKEEQQQHTEHDSQYTMQPQQRGYSWHQWKLDNEDDCWSLYWALTKTIEENDLPILDQFEFHDFMRICQKYTSEPRPPTQNCCFTTIESDMNDDNVRHDSNS